MTFDDLPDAPDPALDPPATFSLKAAAMVLALKNMIVQIRAVLANMSIVAAGGAYALQYTVGANPGAGILTPQLANQQTTPIWYFGETDPRGVSITAILDSLFASAAAGASTSAVKASVRITKVGDLTKWIQFSVTGQPNTYGTYRAVAVTPVAASSATPFAYGDIVVAQITRNGDKGDAGAPQAMVLREQFASGATPAALTAGAWTNRRLNTVVSNTIAGASLGTSASYTFTLPAGKYLIEGSAALAPTSSGTLLHQTRLLNKTSGVADQGTSEYCLGNASYPSYVNTRSHYRGYLELTAPADFTLDHFSSGATAASRAANTGSNEVYAEITILKLV